MAAMTADQVMIATGSATCKSVAMSGDATMTGAGVLSVAALAITNAKIAATTIDLTAKVTGTLPVANGGTGVTTSTGSGANALATSPTLVTPLLGTPTSGTLTNCTGLPVAGWGTGSAFGNLYRAVSSSGAIAVATDADGVVDVTTGSSADVTMTLPTAVGIGGFMTTIRKADSGTKFVQIATTSSQTINGATTNTVKMQYGYVTVMSDGANWMVVKVNDFLTTAAATVSAVTSTQYVDVNSLALTPGEWDIVGQIIFNNNGATISGGNGMAVSLFSANTTTDHSSGDNVMRVDTRGLTDGLHSNTIVWRQTFVTAKTAYVKFFGTYSAGTPQGIGRISARRVG